jgi:hypothetical protein
MQNKANFQKAKIKLTFYSTKDYENEPRLQKPKNKPNQTQSCPPPADSKGTLAYSGDSKRRTSFAGMTLLRSKRQGFAGQAVQARGKMQKKLIIDVDKYVEMSKNEQKFN